MEGRSRMERYAEAQKKVRHIYFRINRVVCPVIDGEYVIFNRIGFHHLIRTGGAPRPKSEQMRRFALLPYVKEIIGNPQAAPAHKEKGNAHYWIFSEMRDDKLIKVVVRQFNGGKKHFLSVYEKKKPS